MKKNDIIKNVRIESITNLGFGVAKLNGMVVFVADTVTGDVADIKIIKSSPSFSVGRVDKMIEYSPLRCKGRCENRECKSCAYKLISYAEELKIKKADVEASFKKAGLSNAKILDVVPSPSEKEYRNKAQYPIAKDSDGSYKIGFYAPKSHRVTEARSCPLAPRVFGEICDTLEGFFKKHQISVYDEESGNGLLRHIYLRRGEISGEVLLTLVINGEKIPQSDELISLIVEKHPKTVGILLSVNKENTNVVLGEKFITLYGRDYIFDTLAGVELKITAPSFYQVNHGAAELLYAKAKELANPKTTDTLLDLYCGAGSIGLSMAKDVRELIGIEIVESAVLCATENARKAGIKNAKFYTGDAKYTEKMLENAEKALGRKINPDIIILDPPRAGCSGELIKYTSSLNPQTIVYISCNHTTLARDAKLFEAFGYKMSEVTPFDLFPMTGHVESICLLKKTD